MPPARYRNAVSDSGRWDDVTLRPGDIVISTPPKCGTTWAQMICALLVLQEPELSAPLATLSPWVDLRTRPVTEMVADLERQLHRRFLKTHTPLDGLPAHEEVTYLCVGRDPRDVAISMVHHWDNLDRGAAAPRRPPVRDRYWHWMEDETPLAEAGSTLQFTLHHLCTFWSRRGTANVVLLHYDDLLADLGAEMRSLAARLGIDVSADRWPALVHAASFDEMRRRAATTVPRTSRERWRDPANFFRTGRSGQWHDLLGPQDRERYARLVRPLAPADLQAWLHRPPL